MVSGQVALVGNVVSRYLYFSLPFNSVMFNVIGKRALKACAVALLASSAVKSVPPMESLKGVFLMPSPASQVLSWSLV